MSVNSFGAKTALSVGDASYEIFRLDAVEGSELLPYSLKILLENLLRTEDGANITADDIRALADQGLSDWGLVGDPPILTEHVDAQFGWMLEAYPGEEERRARYPDDSGLEVSPALRKLHQPQ